MTSTSRTVVFPFVGDSIGGSHLSALLLMENLPRDRFAPLVVLHEKGPLADLLDQREIPYHHLSLPCYVQSPFRSSFRMARMVLGTVPRLHRFIQRCGVAAVHTNDIRMHQTWGLAALTTRAVHVWHQRSVRLDHNRLSKWLAHRALWIIAISEFVRSQLPESLNHKSSVCMNPFFTGTIWDEREKWRRELLEQLKQPLDSLVIGFFGNLVHRKRPKVFLSAAAQVAAGIDRKLVCILAGRQEGAWLAALQQHTRELCIEDRVHFLGFQFPVEPIMAACHAILAPYVDEPFGRVVVEAQLVGTPVVAADSGGIPEIIVHGKTGLLCPVDDPDTMARETIRLLNDRKLAVSIAKRAVEKARAMSMEQHVSNIASLYDRLILGV